MTEKTVTIFVTVYNIEQYLERFFECLSAQTYTDYEVLIVDDGSVDKSLSICREYARKDDRIHVISVEHVGISAARSIAIENIATPYATSLDGDDYFDKDYLQHLMDAEENTSADLIVSNVIIVYEDGTEKERFTPREAGVYSFNDFSELLPALLNEERLNYLYAKLYKTELLKKVHIEANIMQGSDTIINFKYLTHISSIAVTQDYDYYYVRYQKGSITAYGGNDYYMRLCRINRFLMDITQENGLLNDEMRRVIDNRFVHAGKAALMRIAKSDDSVKNKHQRAYETLNSDAYLTSYQRLVQGNYQDLFFERYRYEMIAPDAGEAYIDHVLTVLKTDKRNKRVKRIRKLCPDFLFETWHKLRILTGTARKD